MLSLALCGIATYAKYQPRLFFSLGLPASSSIQANVALILARDLKTLATSDGQDLKKDLVEDSSSVSFHGKENLLRKRKGKGSNIPTPNPKTDSPALICFLVQLCFMVGTAMFVMHVQVATPFLSVSPPIYWYGAYILKHPTRWKLGNLILAVFFCYVSVGSLLFINFYPFT